MESDTTPDKGVFWSRTVTMNQESLTEYAQQVAYRFPQIESPVRNHHTDPDLARAAGFERPVAEPLHYLAFLDEGMLDRYGAAWVHSGELKVAILGPVFAGDVIELRVYDAMPAEGDSSRKEHKLEVLAPGGELVTAGTLSVAGLDE